MFIDKPKLKEPSSFRSEMFKEPRPRDLHFAPKGALEHQQPLVSINIASLRDLITQPSSTFCPDRRATSGGCFPRAGWPLRHAHQIAWRRNRFFARVPVS